MSQINWSKAPEGAEYRDGFDDWYKIGDSGLLMVWYRNAGQWNPSTRPGPYADWHRKPAPTEWTGTGLPPVGVVCNMRISDGRGKAVEILGHGRTRAFIREVHNGEEWSPRLENVPFSVIRTPEQIAADEREAAIDSAADLVVSGTTGISHATAWICSAALYDANFRKQSTKQDDQ